jgi:hypothetical protein
VLVVILDGITCIQEFEAPIQVANKTWFNNIKKKGFKFEIELKPRYTVYYTIEVL